MPFACGARNGVRRISIPSLRNTPSKCSVNLIPVANQKAERPRGFWEGPRQMPSLLCHPLRARIRRAPRDMDTAGAQFDEEEHVQPLQPDRLDGEEVDRGHALPVCSHELTPRHPT